MYYSHSIATEKEQICAYVNRARLFIFQNELDKAKNILEECSKLFPENPSISVNILIVSYLTSQKEYISKLKNVTTFDYQEEPGNFYNLILGYLINRLTEKELLEKIPVKPYMTIQPIFLDKKKYQLFYLLIVLVFSVEDNKYY